MNMLKRLGIDTRNLDVEKLRSDYNTLYSKKETLQKTYKSATKEQDALVQKLDNLNQYLDTPQASVANKNIDKNTKSTLNSTLKKVYRAEAVTPTRYTFNFCCLRTLFPLHIRVSIYLFITMLFPLNLSCFFPYLHNRTYLAENQ